MDFLQQTNLMKAIFLSSIFLPCRVIYVVFFQQSNKCKNLNMCEEIQLNRILTPILLHWTTAIGRSMTVFAHLMLLCD